MDWIQKFKQTKIRKRLWVPGVLSDIDKACYNQSAEAEPREVNDFPF